MLKYSDVHFKLTVWKIDLLISLALSNDNLPKSIQKVANGFALAWV